MLILESSKSSDMQLILSSIRQSDELFCYSSRFSDAICPFGRETPSRNGTVGAVQTQTHQTYGKIYKTI